MKLFLYSSYRLSPAHGAALAALVGKEPSDLSIATIENALDVESDTDAWIQETRDSLGGHLVPVDLRAFLEDRTGLREVLASADVIWVCGGNGFYLRWILGQTGADEIIRELVRAGTVYAGWSAGAVVAGPTLKFFEALENVDVVPEMRFDGLGLTDFVVLPHMDLEEFGDGMRAIQPKLTAAGFTCVPLVEAHALVIDGHGHQIVETPAAAEA